MVTSTDILIKMRWTDVVDKAKIGPMVDARAAVKRQEELEIR